MERHALVSKTYWVLLVVGLALLIGVVALGYGSWWGKPKMEVMKTVSNFTLQQVDGKKFSFDDTKGKVKLVSFIFTKCPDVCPPTTQVMKEMQDELKAKGLFGSKVELITVSFDDENDTPQVLRSYAERFGADFSGWHFLTGNKASIKKATEEFWFGVEKEPNGSFIHTMKTYLVDKDNNLRQIYGMATELDTKKVISDMEQLVKE